MRAIQLQRFPRAALIGVAVFTAIYIAFWNVQAAVALASIPLVLGTLGIFPLLVQNISAILFIIAMIWIAVPEQQRLAVADLLAPESTTAAEGRQPTP